MVAPLLVMQVREIRQATRQGRLSVEQLLDIIDQQQQTMQKIKRGRGPFLLATAITLETVRVPFFLRQRKYG